MVSKFMVLNLTKAKFECICFDHLLDNYVIYTQCDP